MFRFYALTSNSRKNQIHFFSDIYIFFNTQNKIFIGLKLRSNMQTAFFKKRS